MMGSIIAGKAIINGLSNLTQGTLASNMKNNGVPWGLPSNYTTGGILGSMQSKKTSSTDGAAAAGQVANMSITSITTSSLYVEMTSVGVSDLTPSMSSSISELSAALSTSSTTSGLVSIYSLLSLLLETANEQKRVAQMSKQADIAVQQSAIQAQADAQRDAGLFNAILGTCTAVASGGLTIGGAVQGLKGLNTQSNIAKSYNVPQLSGEVKSNFAALDAQQTKVTGLQNQLQALENPTSANAPQGQGAKPGTSNVNNLQKNLTGQNELDGTTPKGENVNVPNENVANDPQDNKGSNPSNELNAKVVEGKVGGDNEGNNVDNTSKENALTKKVNETLNDKSEQVKPGDSKEVQDLKGQIETEKAKLTDCLKNYNESQSKLGVQEKAMMQDPEYVKAAHAIKQSDLLSAIAPTLNSLGQSWVNGFSSILNANATAMGSISKGYEGNEERDKAMIDDAAKLQQQVLQTFSQIVQTESQTARDIIHA